MGCLRPGGFDNAVQTRLQHFVRQDFHSIAEIDNCAAWHWFHPQPVVLGDHRGCKVLRVSLWNLQPTEPSEEYRDADGIFVCWKP